MSYMTSSFMIKADNIKDVMKSQVCLPVFASGERPVELCDVNSTPQ